MENLIIYYGMKVPKIEETIKLTNTLVVLQSYHPIFAQNFYQNFFPNCNRYVYWNCSKVHLSEVIDNKDIAILNTDPIWNTLIVDLKHKKTREFIIQNALSLLESNQVEGLFVDDLDVWSNTPKEQVVLTQLIEELKSTYGKPINFIFNRGLPFWHKEKNLKAVLLESVYPEKIDWVLSSELDWIENLMNLNLKVLSLNEVKVPLFSMKYFEDQNNQPQTARA